MSTAKEIRAWAAAEGIECPTNGPVPNRVVAAYHEAVSSSLSTTEDAEAEDDMTFDVTVRITGVDDDTLLQIEAGLVNALWLAYSQGREAERRVILQQLGVES